MQHPPNPIRARRQAKNWSLQQLADAVGTTKSQIDKLEKGARRLTVEWMVRLAKPLDCDPRDLMADSITTFISATLPLYTLSHRGERYIRSAVAHETLARPTGLSAQAYAIRVPNNVMAPPMRKGQILYVDPAYPLCKNSYTFLLYDDGACALVPSLLRKGKDPVSHRVVGIFDAPLPSL